MSLLDKYQKYLVITTPPEIQPPHYTHIYEVSPDFYNVGQEITKKRQEARNRVVMGRFFKDNTISGTPENGGLEDMINHHKSVLLHVLPLITEYYQSTASYEGILNRIGLNADDGYYCFTNPCMFIAQTFIEKRIGLQEKAQQDLEKLVFPSEDVKNFYLKKFNQL